MTTQKAKNLKPNQEVYYAGQFYEVAEIKEFPHGLMIGIYDEPPTKHIDYINPDNASEVVSCHACQGGGCPVCVGNGVIVH